MREVYIKQEIRMEGQLAQRIALTCHGNAAIAGRTLGRFFPANSTCTFCEYVRFTRPQPGEARLQDIVASSPDEWLAGLANEKATGVRLGYKPQNNPQIADRMTAGFVGGGGDWWLELLRPDGTSEIWVDRWVVGDRDAPENRIWRVTYEHVATGPATIEAAPDLSTITVRLKRALERIRDFAQRQNTGGFVGAFDWALRCFDGRPLDPPLFNDLAIAGTVPEQARILLNAIQPGWVFGGMGSWNDMSFKGAVRDEYDSLSEELFNSLREAAAAAANSSVPAVPKR
jgi:hypothetical protein